MYGPHNWYDQDMRQRVYNKLKSAQVNNPAPKPPEKELPKVRETGDRMKCNEGRNHQMGFALMKRWKNGNYTTLNPFLCCRDYLNDWCFTYKTRISLSNFNVTTKPKMRLVDDDGFFYLGVKIMPHKYDGGYPLMPGSSFNKVVHKNSYGPYSVDVKRLQNNILNVITLLNFADDQFKVQRTTVEEAENGVWAFKIDKFWLQYAYRLSMYTLFLRMAQFWNGKGSPLTFLKAFENISDLQLWQQDGAQMLKYLTLEEKMPEFDLTQIKESEINNKSNSWMIPTLISRGNIHAFGFNGQTSGKTFWDKYRKP